MTELGRRIEREREVIGTLLIRESAYKELPEDFASDWFETFDYRNLNEIIQTEFIQQNLPVNMIQLGEKHPELKDLISDVTFGIIPLDGKLRNRVTSLKRHIPEPREYTSEETKKVKPTKQNDKEKFQFKTLNGIEIYQMEIPEQSFLIKDLFSEQSVNFLSGEEGCGKSLLAMNLALSIAVGAKNCLSYEITKHGKVLYLNNELAFSDFARRLKAMCGALPSPGDISNLIVPKEVPALNDCWDTLNETCEREKPCLIVVDCLYFTHDKDENDSSQMKALMRQFLELRNKHNLALLLIHHTKKAARYEKMHNDQMRGSNVFGGITDTVLQFRRSAMDETKRIIKPTKFRHVSDDNRKCRLLSLDPKTLWFKDEGETEEAEHIAIQAPTASENIEFEEIFRTVKKLSRKEILERCRPLGYDDRTIDRLLKKAKEAGELNMPSYGYYELRHFDNFDKPLQKDVNVKVSK
jgi:hypothetical protein